MDKDAGLRKSRYICPKCMQVYEFYKDELNDSVPVCLRCGVALVRLRHRKK